MNQKNRYLILFSVSIAAGCNALLTILYILFDVYVFHKYGIALFMGVPFGIGFFSTVFYSMYQRCSFEYCLLVDFVSLLFCGLSLILFAIEGLVCVVMAFPIVFFISIPGCILGYWMQDYWQKKAQIFLPIMVLVIPLFMGMEQCYTSSSDLYSVRTEIIIHAPVERVWENVEPVSKIESKL
jgi:hypothetical protein